MALSKISLVRAIVFAVIVALVGLIYYNYKDKLIPTAKNYQAVFLTNGQVYFGKIIKKTPSSTTLTDIYYLQVQQPIQPVAEDDKNKQQTQIQLVKLGNELHKPKDEMVINNEQVLFTEEIQDDGQVGQAITRHKRGETNQPSTSSGQGTQTQTQSNKQ